MFMSPRSSHLSTLALAALLAFGTSAPTRAQESVTVEKLLQDGWEIAGYVSAWENRSLILFRHKSQTYLVQCSILIDVLRSPRMVRACYEIR